MSMEKNKRSPEEQKMLALFDQLRALGDDPDVAGRVILLGPTGSLLAAVSLSSRDVQAAIDALATRDAASYSEEDDAEAQFAEALLTLGEPESLPEPTDVDVDDMLAEAEAFANRGDA